MATPYAKALGVTPPLSTAPPTPAEFTANDDLITELKRQNNYESPEETAKRFVTLSSSVHRELHAVKPEKYPLTNKVLPLGWPYSSNFNP